jgi:hypothetical protein
MIIFPSIDIKDGQCVRLYKGNFDKRWYVVSGKPTGYDACLQRTTIVTKSITNIGNNNAISGGYISQLPLSHYYLVNINK